MRVRGKLVVLAASVAATALTVGIAFAGIPDANGTIHGCYSKSLGTLRVIDPSQNQQCRAIEVALDWNQTGIQGPPGPPGAKGDKGDPGPGTLTIAGEIASAGNPYGGSGFTSLRAQVGYYVIDFPATTFSTFPDMTATPVGSPAVATINFQTGPTPRSVDLALRGHDLRPQRQSR